MEFVTLVIRNAGTHPHDPYFRLFCASASQPMRLPIPPRPATGLLTNTAIAKAAGLECASHSYGSERCGSSQEEDNHALEELLGFPLLKDGTRLGWLMNLNSVSIDLLCSNGLTLRGNTEGTRCWSVTW